MSEWISIRDMMPEVYRTVLVAGGVGVWDGRYWRTYMECGLPVIQWTVTHWMPFPKPPND